MHLQAAAVWKKETEPLLLTLYCGYTPLVISTLFQETFGKEEV
jgi:hypothetical protein